jgi:8-oxo-dGTP pyrophosphatase MutT (NUDIX family)
MTDARVLTDTPGSWPVAASAELASAHVVRLRRDTVVMPDGGTAQREVVEHPGAVAIVALDEAGLVLLIKQYRHPAQATLWEVPAGLRDVDGEPILATAQRELVEEAGYLANDWRVLVDFFSSPGISTERLRVFLARDLTQVPAAERNYVPEHEEAFLTLAWVPLQAAVDAVLAGEMHNGVTAIGVMSAIAASKDGYATLRRADAPETL